MTDTSAMPPRPITHRRVLAIALPIVLSNATIPILGAVDTGVVGQIGDPVPIGAVGIGAVVLSAIYWVFGFLRMGTVGLTSQALGAEDRGEADALLSRALLIGLTGGLVLILLQLPIFAAAFLVSPASPEVETLARDYMAIRVWSAPAAIAIYGITGWLIAAERTQAILVMQIWMNGLNIVLDLVFVLEFGWGVEGVAIATFLAEWTGLGLGLWFCRDVLRRPFWREWSRILNKARLLHMALVNRDILIRSLLLEAIFRLLPVFRRRFRECSPGCQSDPSAIRSHLCLCSGRLLFFGRIPCGQCQGAARPAQASPVCCLDDIMGNGGCRSACHDHGSCRTRSDRSYDHFARSPLGGPGLSSLGYSGAPDRRVRFSNWMASSSVPRRSATCGT